MKPHKHCEIIKAWADGAEIQRATLSGNDWVDDSDPTWNICHEYRIKPRVVKREGWVNIHRQPLPNALQYAIIYQSEAAAIENASTHYLATVKVEWEEEE